MKISLAYVIAIASFSGVSAQSFVKGYAYEDTNRNGRKEKGEKGIAGVSFSNGVEVTSTDSEGLYKLPIGNDNIKLSFIMFYI